MPVSTKPFLIEITREDQTLNGTSLAGCGVSEGELPDGTEAVAILLPKTLVETRLSLFDVPVSLNGAPTREIEPETQAPPEAAQPEPVREKASTAKKKPGRKPGPKPGEKARHAGITPIDGRSDIDVLHLTVPTATRLEENGITTVGRLASKTEAELLEIGLSTNTAALIRSALYKVGHTLTVTDPKLSDICLVPITRRKLNEIGIKTPADLTEFTRKELLDIRGVNDSQLDLFEERLGKFGMALKSV